MKLICMLVFVVAPLCSAQEAFKRLPDLPSGLLLRPRVDARAKVVVSGNQETRCAVEMPQAETPRPDLLMPEAGIGPVRHKATL